MNKLIIAGSGRTVWKDLGKIPNWESYDSMAINDAIMHFPGKLNHAYSNDYKMLQNWVAARRPELKNLDEVLRVHCCFPCEGAELREIKVHGNSGICSVYAALDLGYEEIILCGIPQDNEGHYFNPMKTNYGESARKRPGSDQIRYWSSAAKKWDGKVKSMSGRTREVLGAPKFDVHDNQ